MRTIEIVGEMPNTFGEAMGYISKWGYHTYTKVQVSSDHTLLGKNGLIAVFETDDGHKFAMGAVWDEKNSSYTYHS